uniref:Uncharacterized protein n=1 Tax=Arundo donax TaxID=35708 RepID=A0A0A8YRR3_ARUDO
MLEISFMASCTVLLIPGMKQL